MLDARVVYFIRHLKYDVARLLGLRGKDRRGYDRGEDRRRYPRVPSRNLIKVIALEGQPENLIFNLLDVSEAGFQFAGLEYFENGMTLQVIVNIREFNRQIPMDARIVWSQPITMKVVWAENGWERSSMRQAGAEITEMSEADRYMLRDFVQDKLHHSHSRHHFH